ncbi:hypothetical protein [Streptomyces chiangmaiensis]|uniref:hypothetical protein n=1 Tax=Streptomyces chiangmaiensis TaxID=766497 RepID=UPI0031EBF1D5
MSLYPSPLAGTDLGDTLDDLADIGDRDVARIASAIGRIAVRARNGRIDREDAQLLLAAIAGSPDGTDLVGALGLLVAELTADTNPALSSLTDDARKEAARHGEETAYALTDYTLRAPASRACAALDHTEGKAR